MLRELSISAVVLLSAHCGSNAGPMCRLGVKDGLLQIPENSSDLLLNAIVVDHDDVPLPESLAPVLVSTKLMPDGRLAVFESPAADSATLVEYRPLQMPLDVVQSMRGCLVADMTGALSLLTKAPWYDATGESAEAEETRELVIHEQTLVRTRSAPAVASFHFSLVGESRKGAVSPLDFVVHLEQLLPSQVMADIPNPEPTLADGREVFYGTGLTRQSAMEGSRRLHWAATQATPIYLSSAIPEEYRQAVEDGIEYWNRAFGRSVLAPVQLDAAPDYLDPNLSVIHWLDWPNGDYSYADARFHPSTGELRQTSIYLASSMAEPLGSEADLAVAKVSQRAKFWKPSAARLCRHPAHSSSQVRMLGIKDPVALQKGNLDAIASLVAHEVGHILGLRHNFAATLETTITPAQYEQQMLRLGHGLTLVPLGTPASSVMDYANLEFDIAIGELVRSGGAVLAYDRQIAAVMDGKSSNVESMFCNDEMLFDEKRATGYRDCAQFDAYASPLQAPIELYRERLRRTARQLAQGYGAYISRAGSSISVAIDPASVADDLADATEALSPRIDPAADFLTAERGVADPKGLGLSAVRSRVEQMQREALGSETLSRTEWKKLFLGRSVATTSHPGAEVEGSWAAEFRKSVLDQMLAEGTAARTESQQKMIETHLEAFSESLWIIWQRKVDQIFLAGANETRQGN